MEKSTQRNVCFVLHQSNRYIRNKRCRRANEILAAIFVKSVSAQSSIHAKVDEEKDKNIMINIHWARYSYSSNILNWLRDSLNYYICRSIVGGAAKQFSGDDGNFDCQPQSAILLSTHVFDKRAIHFRSRNAETLLFLSDLVTPNILPIECIYFTNNWILLVLLFFVVRRKTWKKKINFFSACFHFSDTRCS